MWRNASFRTRSHGRARPGLGEGVASDDSDDEVVRVLEMACKRLCACREKLLARMREIPSIGLDRS